MSDFDFFKDESPIKNNMVMDSSRFLNVKNKLRSCHHLEAGHACMRFLFVKATKLKVIKLW